MIGESTLVIKWDDGAIKERLRQAAESAVEDVLIDCVNWAKDFHEYMDETGELEASIYFLPPERIGPMIVGRWGAAKNYALYLEIGTSRPWSGAPKATDRARMAGGDMWSIMPPQPTGPHTNTLWTTRNYERVKIPGQGPLMSPRLSLRPAADVFYPQLAERIEQHYAEGT